GVAGQGGSVQRRWHAASACAVAGAQPARASAGRRRLLKRRREQRDGLHRRPGNAFAANGSMPQA
ncbi:hypothetical protein MHH60_29005, partial [Paenibacillus sp. FSL H7-0716]|uniref:hypothetical protein n=1 Tax=Paenibacillus sp. FSL H7-0716 TaxID=2921439 RepID=UPI0030F7CD3E